MSLLVTGAKGYVGRHFMESYVQNRTDDCIGIDIDEIDLSDWKSVDAFFAENRIDSILHLAACLDNNDSEALLKSNVIGLINLLKACKKYGIGYFVFASTNNVYGTENDPPFHESDCMCPDSFNNYASTKCCGELLTADMLKDSETAYSIVRIGDIYGPNQKVGALLKAVVGSIVNSAPQKLYGTGDRTRDYIYIDDVVSGFTFFVDNKVEGTYNLATGVGTSVADIVKIAESISTCTEETIPVPVEKEDHSKVVLDVSKLSEAGWTYSVSFAEGLKKIVESFK